MCLLDVTERHAAAELLRFEARHDHATGLANRNLVLETISDLLPTPEHARRGALHRPRPLQDGQRLARPRRRRRRPAHHRPPARLRGAGRRAPSAGSPATSSSSCFPNATVEEAQALGARLLARLCEPVRIMRRDLVVTGSIGIVVTEPGAGQGVARAQGRRRDATCCATPTSPCTTPSSTAVTGSPPSTSASGAAPSTASRSRKSCATASAAGELLPGLPADRRARHAWRRRPSRRSPAGRIRSAGGAADRLHPDRRGDRAHRSPGPADAGAGHPAGRRPGAATGGVPIS